MQIPAASSRARVIRAAVLACAAALVTVEPLVLAQQAPVSGPALERVRGTGRLRIGYRVDARPFSYTDESGVPAGYSIALCRAVGEALKTEAGLSAVQVEWVPVTAGDRFDAIRSGRVDVLCGADTVTLSRRADVSFSIPIFPGGLGALVRADAPARLREALTGGQVYRPVWRAAAATVLQSKAFSAVAGTTTERWLSERIRELKVIADISLVSSYDAGLQALLDRRSDAFFGERAVLLDAVHRHASARDLLVVDRLFTYEPLALALPRGDEALRLAVDRALSRFYRSGELGDLYTRWFGEPDATALAFFRWNSLPE